MTSDLHAQLRDLAADAPAPAPGGSGELWRAGKRRQRRRTAAGVVAACAVVLAGVGGVSTVHPSTAGFAQAPVTAPNGPSRLPDRFHTPSRWLPTTAEAGPVGPLALVITAQEEHDLVGSEPGYVGVSAVTGEYRFLSLPDLPRTVDGAWGDELALSPDGSKVGYWYGGYHDAEFSTLHPEGIAVYDTITGDIVRHSIEAPWRIQAEQPVWVGDKLWISWFEQKKGEPGSGFNGRTVIWDFESDEFRDLPGADVWMPDPIAAAHGSWVQGTETGTRVIDRNGRVVRNIAIAGRYEGAVVLSPDGSHLATRRDPDGNPSTFTDEPAPLLVGAATEELSYEEQHAGVACKVCPPIKLREVPDSKDLSLVGWRDDRRLVVIQQEQVSPEKFSWSYRSLDPTTGQLSDLVEPEGLGSGNFVVAADAWSWPTWDAPAPDEPVSPRAVLGWSLAASTVLGLVALRIWRRRERG